MKVKKKFTKNETIKVELSSEDIERIVYEHLVREGVIHANGSTEYKCYEYDGSMTITQTVTREE
jgi:hypothetical protein